KELAELASREMGKTLKEAIAEIEKCHRLIAFYEKNFKELFSEKSVSEKGLEADVVLEPLGTIVGVMPWNFPYWQVFRFAVPTILAGNTVLLKHAANTLGCAQSIEKLFKEADAPEGLFAHIIASHDDIKTLLGDNRVKGVSLTGSTKAGRVIGELAGRYLKKSVLELGGSDPYVILADADIEVAIDKCVQSRLINNGQSCIAAKRFIVHESLFDVFLEGMKKRFESKVLGNPLSSDTDIGPLARKDLKEEIESQIDRAIEAGATLVEVTHRQPQKGFFMSPKILTGIGPQNPIFKKELFGPVAMVFPFDAEQEALQLANLSPFGLGAAIFSRDTEKAYHFAVHDLQAGMVAINDIVRSDPRVPFGGVKSSGYGRELGRFGHLEFANIKTIIKGS
ncbi:MAG: NAD-dependent succinate-semialdehyde dehydrogenase, partial [Bdellovibrionales bacterium]|nr:NAD-dependent succinate-semialdehyde dehydrogenase [Bdellovibrionales bacterium]